MKKVTLGYYGEQMYTGSNNIIEVDRSCFRYAKVD